MDRFIEMDNLVLVVGYRDLKSSMDRFIVVFVLLSLFAVVI